jgi:hypothetical protein
MITLINKDRFIYDLEYRVPDIIKEYQTTGKVEISVNNEGICLRKVKFYDLLDYVCDKFDINKSKITIFTSNQLEYHSSYKIVTSPYYFIKNQSFNELIPEAYDPFKSAQLKTLGCFVGRPSWNRLILISWLFENYKDNCLLTCNYTASDSDRSYLSLDEVMFYDAENLNQVISFLKHTPMTLDNRYDKSLGHSEHYKGLFNLLNYYNQIFLDLVTETYVIGNTFFPTEKTTRPIIAKTPFIVMGPKNYLSNLKKIGFKTFSRWWDESYDYLEGTARVIAIKKIVTEIMTWPQDRLNAVLSDMQETLEHNYKCNYDMELINDT